jgi:nucleoside 2-deoxyribosyltransferase
MQKTAERLTLEPFATGAKPTIYLAGAIDKVPPEFATTWRRAATRALEHKYKILDPTAGKDLFAPGVNTDVYTPAQIVESDLAAIKKTDIVLAEISRKDIPYHGTSMELAYAYQWQKIVYVWGGCRSYWVRYHATQIFDELADALEHLIYG